MEQEKKSPEIVLWDFNGTILDDVDAGIEAVNELLCECECAPIPSREYYQETFGFPIREYYARIGFDFAKHPYEVLAPRWVEKYLRCVKSAVLFDDVRTTLDALRSRGVRQIVLSATERQMLEGQLEDLGIRELFEQILGLDNIHAASKLSLAKAWRAEHPSERVILIGDTDHDVETARAIGVECVLVARGHQSKERLKVFGVPVFTSLREVLDTYF
ncbi:MAG: HAD hydrolase-like protein [Clostridia bacterium]|nr:HAD hydrolase-like protein [Clostridia bacterium]